MKALVLKDFYTVKKYLKSLFALILVMAIGSLNFGKNIEDVAGIVAFSGLIYGMSVLTTFTFDDMSNFNKFALISPITKKTIIKSKFMSLFLFTLVGIIVGATIAFVGTIILAKNINFVEQAQTYVILIVLGLVASMILNSTSIPFVYKFGVEKARNYMLITYLIPIGVGYGIIKILEILNIEITKNLFFGACLCSPTITFVWIYLMYRLSIIFWKKNDNI